MMFVVVVFLLVLESEGGENGLVPNPPSLGGGGRSGLTLWV